MILMQHILYWEKRKHIKFQNIPRALGFEVKHKKNSVEVSEHI